jgi:hypothetical protein
MQEIALSPSLRETPVGADHAMPWEPFVSSGKNVTDQSRRFRVDVAVGADKSNRNRAYAADDARCTRGTTSGFRHWDSNGCIKGHVDSAIRGIRRDGNLVVEAGHYLNRPGELVGGVLEVLTADRLELLASAAYRGRGLPPKGLLIPP